MIPKPTRLSKSAVAAQMVWGERGEVGGRRVCTSRNASDKLPGFARTRLSFARRGTISSATSAVEVIARRGRAGTEVGGTLPFAKPGIPIGTERAVRKEVFYRPRDQVRSCRTVTAKASSCSGPAPDRFTPLVVKVFGHPISSEPRRRIARITGAQLGPRISLPWILRSMERLSGDRERVQWRLARRGGERQSAPSWSRGRAAALLLRIKAKDIEASSNLRQGT